MSKLPSCSTIGPQQLSAIACRQVASSSTAAAVRKPAASNPKSRPPIPVNRLMTVGADALM